MSNTSNKQSQSKKTAPKTSTKKTSNSKAGGDGASQIAVSAAAVLRYARKIAPLLKGKVHGPIGKAIDIFNSVYNDPKWWSKQSGPSVPTILPLVASPATHAAIPHIETYAGANGTYIKYSLKNTWKLSKDTKRTAPVNLTVDEVNWTQRNAFNNDSVRPWMLDWFKGGSGYTLAAPAFRIGVPGSDMRTYWYLMDSADWNPTSFTELPIEGRGKTYLVLDSNIPSQYLPDADFFEPGMLVYWENGTEAITDKLYIGDGYAVGTDQVFGLAIVERGHGKTVKLSDYDSVAYDPYEAIGLLEFDGEIEFGDKPIDPDPDPLPEPDPDDPDENPSVYTSNLRSFLVEYQDAGFKGEDEQFAKWVLPYIRQRMINLTIPEVSILNRTLNAVANIQAMYAQLCSYKTYQTLDATYPVLNDRSYNGQSAYPCFDALNNAQFEGIKSNIRNYLDTTVKIPTNLSQYIQYRYGTFFKSKDAHNPCLIKYTIIPLTYTPDQINERYNEYLREVDFTALNILFELYKNHKQARSVISETVYCRKENLLRLNSQVISSMENVGYGMYYHNDSYVSNQEATLSSTMSYTKDALIPIKGINIHYVGDRKVLDAVAFYFQLAIAYGGDALILDLSSAIKSPSRMLATVLYMAASDVRSNETIVALTSEVNVFVDTQTTALGVITPELYDNIRDRQYAGLTAY